MSFKVCNLGSKRPHLHSAYVLGVYNNLGTTVVCLIETTEQYLKSDSTIS